MFYPIKVSKTDNGRFVVTARDVPECIYSDKTEEAALKSAQEMVPGVLELYYRRKKKAFPLPSQMEPGEIPVYVPARIQAKIAFWNFLVGKGMKLADAARALEQPQARVQCMVDLSKDKASIEAIEEALEKLGGEFNLTAKCVSKSAE